MRLMLIAALAISLPACTFVEMAPKASTVKVLATAPACEKRGEAEVSVRHKVGFYERSEAQVRDELETLARNEAPGVGADTISPLGAPVEGGQSWALWRCGH